MAERALATAFVNIVPGTKDFESKLKGQLTGQMPGIGATAGKGFSSGFSGALKKLAATAAAAFAVGSVARFGKETILLAEDVQVANARLEQIAKSMNIFGSDTGAVTKRLMDYAAANEMVFAADAEVIKGTQAKLLTFKELAATADEAGGSFDRATQAAFDLAAAGFGSAETNAVQLGKALQDPIKGITALARSGVTFTNAEKERITTLVESNKIGEAQNLVLKAIETQVGGTAAATAKASDRLALGWESVKESIGLTLLPAFESITTKLVGDVFPKVQDAVGRLPDIFKSIGSTVGPVVQGAFSQIGAIVASVGPSFTVLIPQIMQLASAFSPIATILPIIIPFLGEMAEKLLPALAQVVGAVLPVMENLIGIFSDLATQLITALLPIFNDLVDVVVQNLVPLFVSLAPVIAQLGTTIGQVLSNAIRSLVPVIKTFVSFIMNLYKAIMPLVKVVLELAAVLIGELLKALDPIIKAILPAFNNLLKMITPVITTVVKVLVAVLVPAVKVVVAILKVIIGVIGAVLTWFAKLIAGVVKTAANIQQFFIKLPGQILGFVKNAGTWLMQTGKDLIDGLLNGAGQILPKIGEFFLDMLPGWIVEPFKKALGIASPSKVFTGFGKNIIQGLQRGLTGNASSIESTMAKVKDKITKAFEDKKITARTATAARALVATYTKALLSIERELEKVKDRLGKAQDELNDKIQEQVDYVKGIVGQYGSTLTLENVATDPLKIAEAQNQLNEAQSKYNEILKDTESTATEIEKARLDVLKAEQDLADVQKGSTTAADAIGQLQERINKSKELRRLTSQLIDLGLDKDIIRQIVEAQAVDFAQSVIAGGKAAVKELNVLADEANEQARLLGKQVGKVLFDEGIEFAKSVVKGLQDRETELNNLMDRVAKEFGNNLERVLKGLKIETSQVDNALGRITFAPMPNINNNAPAINPPKGGGGGGGGGGSAMPWQFMAAGGYVTGPTPAIIGEAGPEVVVPLRDFERMMGITDGAGKTINYYAAPNQSLDSEQALFQAMKRAKVVAGW